jgi:hypothetical protein
VLGWQVKPVACSTAQLAALLGLDRAADFGLAEREEPDTLFELLPNDLDADDDHPLNLAQPTDWQGLPNRLDRHPMYRWPVIDTVSVATRVPTEPPEVPMSQGGSVFCSVDAPQPEATALQSVQACAGRLGAADFSPARCAASSLTCAEDTVALTFPNFPRSTELAATLIRQRRSAQHFDARARMPLNQLWLLLRALHPAQLPFDAWPADPRVHVLLFAHRVDGLAPGAYLLPRSAEGHELLRRNLPSTLELHPVPDAPEDAPLLLLSENPALAGTLRTLNCHQALGSDAILGFALLAEFNPLPDAATYRKLFQEAGLIGQVLYLEAEALGLRGTGIGCFFDDALHQLIGLPEPAASAPLQSVYHFTVGVPKTDARIATEPPYAHLLTERQGVDHG